MTTRDSSTGHGLRSMAAAALCATLAVSACASSAGEDAATSSAELGVCSFAVTKNTYDGPNYWGTIAFKNGSSAVSGVMVAFDVPSGAHCTNDSVPSGATLAPLQGSGASATTTANHCVFTWHGATLSAGASKTFNYSTDSSQGIAAANVVVSYASCSSGGGVDAGAPDTGGGGGSDCGSAGLVWRSANKTSFTSYPAPGSPECIQYNGCAYEGQFAACSQTESKAWVAAHNIVSVFPNLHKSSNGIGALALHDLCIKSGSKTMVVTVLDECADSDCSGCCTQNKGSAAELIDIESFTDARFGVDDGPIEWADLGATKTTGCN
jgi:hypothetical protein